MLPRLFSIGPFTVYSYGALLGIALILGLLVAAARARRRGLDGARILDLGLILVVTGILGAKALLLIVDLPSVLARPWEALTVMRAGGVFYGGLVAAIAVGIWYMRRHGLPLWQTCDVFAPGIAAGHVVGRLGCLAAGCCYGRPTGMPWGITFHDSFANSYVGTPLGIPLHPTQLYESGAELSILVALLLAERHAAKQALRAAPQSAGAAAAGRVGGFGFPGGIFWLYLALYAVSRFTIEFFRGDERGMLLGVSTSQAISLAILPCSLAALALLRRHARAAAADHGRTAPAHG